MRNNIFWRIGHWFKWFGWGWKGPWPYVSAILHPINFFKCLRYPFLKVYHRWTGKFMGYSSREDYAIPIGWFKAFGKDLIRDIDKAGKASRKRLHKHLSWRKMITWEDIKEKYGTLRLYASATTEIMDVLDKYELLSYFYCIDCGKKAKYVTRGWIELYCEDCFEKASTVWDSAAKKYVPCDASKLAEWKKEDRLIYPDDLPGVTCYIKKQEFNSKAEFDKVYKEQKKKDNILNYDSVLNPDGSRTWFIEYKNVVPSKVDLEKKYNLNFKELASDWLWKKKHL